MTAPLVDGKPVYDTYEQAQAANDRQQRTYGICTGVVTLPDGRFQLRYDVTGGAR